MKWRCLNGCQLVDFLQSSPVVLVLDHQIALFSRAKHVVGVSGAAMTNIAFCGPETKITVLVPGTFPDTFFWFIAQHRHLDFVEILGDNNLRPTGFVERRVYYQGKGHCLP